MHLMIAQHVTDILAKEAFDAFSKFLHTIDVLLLHAPGAVGSIRRSRLEFPDLFLHSKIPRDIGYQILYQREGLHRLNRNRFLQWQIAQARHAHQPRHAVDLGRTRATLAGFAIPAAGKIVRLRRLNVIDRVKHYHSLGNTCCVIPKLAAVRVTPPDFENCGFQSVERLNG
jgi:hypothetical protein